MKVPFYRHELGVNHARKVAAVIESPHLTYGAIGKRVETSMGAFLGDSQVALTSSWSSAAFATFKCLGIGAGDEVIVPAMTFAATANIALLCGATPVFADVDPDTLLITAQSVRKVITSKTKAVFCVHLYGQMCDMLALRQLADENGLFLLEDAAHAFEAQRDGICPSLVSDAALFSFYATKNLTCGEGGAVATRNPKLYGDVCRFRSHGMSASAADRFNGAYYQHWDVEAPGMKASLPDILAAMLEPQVERCLDLVNTRQRLADRYRAAFQGTLVRCPQKVAISRHAEHLFAIHVEPNLRDAVLQALNSAGIGCTVNYRSLPQLSLFKDQTWHTPHADRWGAGTLSLPLYPSLSQEAQDYVIKRTLDAVEMTQSQTSASFAA